MYRKITAKATGRNTVKGLKCNALIILVAFLSALCFIHIKVQHTRTGYEISTNRQLQKELINEGQILFYELSEIKSPQRLVPVAKQMGFRFATTKDIVFIEEVMVASGRTE